MQNRRAARRDRRGPRARSLPDDVPAWIAPDGNRGDGQAARVGDIGGPSAHLSAQVRASMVKLPVQEEPMLDMFASSTGTQGVSKAAVWQAWLRVPVYR